MNDHEPILPAAPGSRPARLTLDKLPIEVLTLIFQYVMEFSPVDRAASNLVKIITCCGALYDVGIPALYRRVAFPYPHTFEKFRHSIERTGYGALVRVLDFSAFTSVGLGRTGKMMQEIQMVTSTTILRALELCPNLNEFLVAESVDNDIDARVVSRLCAMPLVNTLDFCACTSRQGFVAALASSAISDESGPPLHSLSKLSFHACSTIPNDVLARIMPKLVSLTRLDLTHTLVTPDVLLSLPDTARITHLSLSKCVKLNSHGLLKFLLLHPATRHLEWLNLMFESTKPVPLSNDDFETILRYLPPLKYLNLYGLPFTEKHLRHLVHMTDLRALSLGYADIRLEVLFKFIAQMPSLRYLDLTGNPYVSVWTLQDASFYKQLERANPRISIVEVSADKMKNLKGLSGPGWLFETGRGRRAWIFKEPVEPVPRRDSGVLELNFGGGGIKPPPQVPGTKAFSFAGYAQERIRQRSSPEPSSNLSRQLQSSSAAKQPPTADEDPHWRYASRKINMSQVGLGGVWEPSGTRQKGIYSYYAFHN